MANDPFGARTTLNTGSEQVEIFSLKTLDERTDGDVFSLPFSIRVVLESLLRNAGGIFVSKEDVEALADWPESVGGELAYLPARVVMQDFTGVPAVVDLAAMRSAMENVGGDPGKINPLVPIPTEVHSSVLPCDGCGIRPGPAVYPFDPYGPFLKHLLDPGDGYL
ncbi:MAG TPA: aconitase family protein, partial [Rubrobacter sp.]|nr:aconitase family protein [Rubrobacter sp.]